jgi:anti-anti-sigma regulatory factor
MLIVRLDLSKLEFIDTSGMYALLDALHDAGKRVEVEPDLAPKVRRLLELTRTDRLIVAHAGTNS